MGKQLFRFTFSSENVALPIVYQTGLQFGLTTNIMRANIGRDGGWVILELLGDSDDLERAVDWVRERGVSVEAVPGDLTD